MPKILGTTIQTLVDQVGGTYLCNPVIDSTFDRKLAEFLGQQYNWLPNWNGTYFESSTTIYCTRRL